MPATVITRPMQDMVASEVFFTPEVDRHRAAIVLHLVPTASAFSVVGTYG
jgi:hypothetical protein